jgi:hypothetical protein
MAYQGWPIVTFILSEIARPHLRLDEGEGRCARAYPSDILAGRVANNSENEHSRAVHRRHALLAFRNRRRTLASVARRGQGCLDESRQFQARATQVVTLRKTGEKRTVARPGWLAGVVYRRHLPADQIGDRHRPWRWFRQTHTRKSIVVEMTPTLAGGNRNARLWSIVGDSFELTFLATRASVPISAERTICRFGSG